MANKKKVVEQTDNVEEKEKVEIPEEVKEAIQTNTTAATDDSVIEEIVEKIAEEATYELPTHRTVLISATSKVSTQLNDVWYGFNFTETREILNDSNMEYERQCLWDDVNMEVDKQVEDVISMLKNPQQPQ